MVKVCVTGCLHGELDKVYADIAEAEQAGHFKCHLVLCCGDFQSIRNPSDLAGMSVPPKYSAMGDFWRYYAEQRKAPVLTIFIGGNHESSGYLQELPYGGWVAPNIWYMGYAGVVQFGGLRIAGLSGIYKQHDYTMGHFERIPYSESTKRSVYHTRNLEVFRLGQIRRPLDIVLSHDWPRGIYHYGNSQALLRKKPFFANEIESDTLGSPPAEQLLCRLRPRYWFSAHLHCCFSALVEFSDNPPTTKPQQTRFLALDKCLPRRDYLRFIDIEPQANDSFLGPDADSSYLVSRGEQSAETDEDESSGLYLDPEWLCILRSTNQLMSTSQVPCILPGRNAHERCDFSVSDTEIQSLYELFGGEFSVPDNFERTAEAYKPDDQASSNPKKMRMLLKGSSTKQQMFSNPQTELLCAMLDLINPNALLLGRESYSLNELSSGLVTKETDDVVPDDEEEEELREDPITLDCKPACEEAESSFISSRYSPGIPDTTEYDPLESSTADVSSSEQAGVSHNPEEVHLDDISDEQDDDEGDPEYNPTSRNLLSDSPPGGYLPTTVRPDSSTNVEEIPLADSPESESDGENAA